MKFHNSRNWLLAAFITAFAIVCFTGCVRPSIIPAIVSNGVTNAPAHVVYDVSPGLSNAAAQVNSGLAMVSPFLAATPLAPAAPLLPPLAAGFFALLTLISGYVAKNRNDAAAAAQASADSHSAAAAALAATVASLNSATVPAVATAINYATQNGSSSAVAAHLADAANPVQTASPQAAGI